MAKYTGRRIVPKHAGEWDIRKEYEELQIVLETDCPYMSPEPYRGKRNSSLNLSYVAEALAKIKGITAEEVIAATEENAKKLLFR